MSSSTSKGQDLVLFARGILALLDSWDVLKLAISEGWGGPQSYEKRTWLASVIVDEFDTSSSPPHDSTPARIPDLDDITDLILQALSDEFDVDVEDGSVERVADSIIKLWTAEPAVAAQMVSEFEATARKNAKATVQAVREDGNGDSDWDSESEDEDGVPRLVEREVQSVPKEKQEPVVDDDGFTLVQGKGKGRK
ncbi:Pre-rRNA-processing protein TSR2 [Ceratobasidium sp. AG-Ba]|nr:Pre-rRNA-processing protein TSR2 [Ceratobasidium sp. AG-Ba]